MATEERDATAATAEAKREEEEEERVRGVIFSPARHCAATGFVLAPAAVDGREVHVNLVMSSRVNVLGPAAARGLAEATAGSVQSKRAWPVMSQAVGTVRRPNALVVAGVDVPVGPGVRGGSDGGDDGDDDDDGARGQRTGSDAIEFLYANDVIVGSLPDAQLGHRVAQAHACSVSVARPEAHARPSIIDRLRKVGVIGRASILWDMRRAPDGRAAVALGARPDPADAAEHAAVRLYRPDDPEVIAAGEAIVALARWRALARIVAIEVTGGGRGAATARLPVGPLWAMVDLGVRSCYFEQGTRRLLVEALAEAGPDAAWRRSPLWTQGSVLTRDAAGVLERPAAEAPRVTLLMAAKADPSDGPREGRAAPRQQRCVPLHLGRDAYVRASPPHRVRFAWAAADAPFMAPGPSAPSSASGERDAEGPSMDLRYALVDISSWSNMSPLNTCLVGNSAFYGRVALVDYEDDAITVMT
jgi:hypothetical protein